MDLDWLLIICLQLTLVTENCMEINIFEKNGLKESSKSRALQSAVKYKYLQVKTKYCTELRSQDLGPE